MNDEDVNVDPARLAVVVVVIGELSAEKFDVYLTLLYTLRSLK